MNWLGFECCRIMKLIGFECCLIIDQKDCAYQRSEDCLTQTRVLQIIELYYLLVEFYLFFYVLK
jgi:hypothetical protein